MITSYEFPNQWNWRIFLCILDEDDSILDALIHLNNKENCEFNLDDNSLVEAPCFVQDLNNLVGVICIKTFNNTIKDISICVHELTHLMISISEVSGCPINLNTTEAWAYFLSNITQMFLEILNSHFKELN